MKKVLFIVNPRSGVADASGLERLAHHWLPSSKYEINICHTQRPGHATELAYEFSKIGGDIVVAVGGDGTVNEIVQGLKTSSTTLAIVPKGSGNGLARSLAIPLDMEKAIQLIDTGKASACDIGHCDLGDFSVAMGIGFDAEVAHRFNQLKVRGFGSYIKTTVKTWYRSKDFRCNIRFGDQQIAGNYWIVTVANTAQYGNNALIAPKAKTNDGLLDIALLRKPNILQLLTMSARLFTGKLEQSSLYQTYQASSIHISGKLEYLHLDGEPFEGVDSLKISVLPKHCKIITPTDK